VSEGREGGVGMSDRIVSFRDLKVYQTAFTLQQEVFHITKKLRD
jgi:hypothetical protein